MTDACQALRHAIQDLIDRGDIQFAQPSVSANPLPTYDTHAVPPPAGGIHLIQLDEDDGAEVMMLWVEEDYDSYDQSYGPVGQVQAPLEQTFESAVVPSGQVSASTVGPTGPLTPLG